MRLKRLSLVLLFGALPIGGIGASAVYAQGQQVPVELTEWSITPSTITVQAGQPVRFMATNPGQRPHDLHIEGQGVMMEIVPGDGNIAAGQMASADFTFTTPGSYQMWCPVGNHRAMGMEGTFVVTAAAAGAPAAQPKPAASPAAQPAPKPAAPAPGPAQAPGALPRTGDPGATLLVGVLGVAGAALFSAGAALRRRRRQ